MGVGNLTIRKNWKAWNRTQGFLSGAKVQPRPVVCALLSLEHIARVTGVFLMSVLGWGDSLPAFCSSTAVKRQ
jgi:hypothetical protein